MAWIWVSQFREWEKIHRKFLTSSAEVYAETVNSGIRVNNINNKVNGLDILK